MPTVDLTWKGVLESKAGLHTCNIRTQMRMLTYTVYASGTLYTLQATKGPTLMF